MGLARELELEVIRRQIYEIDSVDHLRLLAVQMLNLLEGQKQMFHKLASEDFGKGG